MKALTQEIINRLGPPQLWADGLHDDTAALEWHLNHGHPVPAGTYAVLGTHWPSSGKILLEKQFNPPFYLSEVHIV